MTGWQIAAFAFGTLALVLGVLLWRASQRDNSLGKTAKKLARKNAAAVEREAQAATDEAARQGEAAVEAARDKAQEVDDGVGLASFLRRRGAGRGDRD